MPDIGFDVKSLLKPKKIFIPIILGMSVASWLLYINFDKESFSFLVWSASALFWIFISFVMMAIRDLAYMYRIIILTDKKLTWKQSFNVIMLWEFSSAVSPSVVGGVAPAVYFLYKEGINVGKSTSIALTSILLDELFFVFMVPLLFFSVGSENIFPVGNSSISLFASGYFVIFIYTFALAYAIFINPKLIKKLLSYIFLLPVIKRYRMAARKSGNQLINASTDLKGKNLQFWIKAFFATFIAWTARYWVVNFMFLAFFANRIDLFDHLLIYARQLIMWLIMLISPTPGASGVSEYIFKGFLSDIIPNSSWAVPLAMLWRLISYYPYLFIGAFILPRWIKKVH